MSEHGLLRALLQRLGSTYQYTEPLAETRVYMPVERRAIITRPAPAVAPAVPGPDALGFALHARRDVAPIAPAPMAPPTPAPPVAARPAPRPAPPATAPGPAALALPAPVADPVADLVAGLHARGHRILNKDGRLFVTEAPLLNEADRTAIRAHGAALFAYAEAEKPVSLATFLGNPAPQQDYSWRAGEPPNLDGVTDILLNFETNGLHLRRNEPIGVTVGTLDGRIKQYLPWGHTGGNLDKNAVIRYLQSIRGKHIHNTNTRFDLHMGHRIGVDFEAQGNTVTDIAHTVALLDDHRKRFSLDILAADLLPGGVQIPRVDESRMADYHAAEVARRAEYQVELVAQLTALLYPQIRAQGLEAVQHLEDSVIYPVVEMERNGAPIDIELLEQYYVYCNRLHDDLLWQIAREVGFAFDHTAETWRRLFERYNIGISHLKTKKETFADGVIAAVDHPIFRKARFAAQLASLNSKIFKPYREMVEDGMLYVEFHQLRGEEGGTVSGRFSAPYIQQVPNYGNHMASFSPAAAEAALGYLPEGYVDMFPRRLYVAGPEGDFLAADAAQIQYRIFAHHANNPAVMAAYAADPTVSFHRLIMKKIQPHKPDIIYEHLKSMNFMIIFGGKLVKIALMMGHITAAEADELNEMDYRRRIADPRLQEALTIQRIYDREMPEVEPLLEKASHLAKSSCDNRCNQTARNRQLHRELPHRGYVKTIMGRRSRFPDNYRLHKAFCMVDQGSEGDIVKTKLVELHRERKTTGFIMRATVHDEVWGTARQPDTLRMVDEILNRQSFPEIKVPILWECGVGPSWAEAKG